MCREKANTLILAVCFVFGLALALGSLAVGLQPKNGPQPTRAIAAPPPSAKAPIAERSPSGAATDGDTSKLQRQPDATQPVANQSETQHPITPVSRPISLVRRANYDSLDINMTLAEVQQILGTGTEVSRAGGILTMRWHDPEGNVTIVATFHGATPGSEPTLYSKSIRD